MIDNEYIAKLKRMGPRKIIDHGTISNGSHPVPLDFLMFEEDMIEHNFLICSIEVLYQMLRILPQLPYMNDVKPVSVGEVPEQFIAFDMWYPVVKRVVFAPCKDLQSEYWAVTISLIGDIINIDDVQSKPHHTIGVTSD